MAAKSNVMFSNLRAEMARTGVGISDMASSVHCNRDTLSRKLSGKTTLSLKDAFQIRDAYFPDKDLFYLFSELVPTDTIQLDSPKAG